MVAGPTSVQVWLRDVGVNSTWSCSSSSSTCFGVPRRARYAGDAHSTRYKLHSLRAIRVDSGICPNRTASQAHIDEQAQNYFDEALLGERRASVIVEIREVVKVVEIDVTALKLTKEQAAVFATQENVKLVNVPAAIQKFLDS